MTKLKIVAAVVGAVLCLLLLIGAVWGLQWATAPFRGAKDARETIQADGDFRIQAYNTFFDRCASVQTAESRITSLEEELETDPPQSRVTQIQSSLSAIRSQRANTINIYNSEAERDWTVGQFRDEGLPHQLDINDEETECSI